MLALTLCTPAQLYVALGTVSALIALVQTFKVVDAFGSLLLVAVWGAVLNGVCWAGYPAAAWALLVLPWILLIGNVAGIAAFLSG